MGPAEAALIAASIWFAVYLGYVLLAGMGMFWVIVWPDGHDLRRLRVVAVVGLALIGLGAVAETAGRLAHSGARVCPDACVRRDRSRAVRHVAAAAAGRAGRGRVLRRRTAPSAGAGRTAHHRSRARRLADGHVGGRVGRRDLGAGRRVARDGGSVPAGPCRLAGRSGGPRRTARPTPSAERAGAGLVPVLLVRRAERPRCWRSPARRSTCSLAGRRRPARASCWPSRCWPSPRPCC